MNVDRAYVRRAMHGVVRLGFQDAKGLQALDLTLEGFFRSFYALALAAPVYAFTTLGQMRITEALMIETGEGHSVSFTAFILVHVLNFFGGALLFLAAMAPLARLLDVKQRYAAFAIAYNWATLAINLLFVPISILFALGLISAADATSLNLIAIGFALYYRFASFRTVLDVPWSVALAMALIDLLLQWVWYLFLASLA